MPARRITCAEAEDIKALRAWLAGRDQPADVDGAVREIIDDVRERGDEALVDYGRRFDCESLSLDALAVSEADMNAAMDRVPKADLDVLAEAADNIRSFHQEQRAKSWFTTRPDGTVLGQMVVPVDRVGLYVPGGRGGETPLVSSLLMNAIPAQVAGVGSMAVATPPMADGGVNAHLLATARLLGITEVWRMGSAWAVAALALGTGRIRPVDVLAGPGNVFVATAKRLLSGKVGTDMIAGPSEILILCDGSTDPAWLAADMLSQAEHDPLASALLVTADPDAAQAVADALEDQLAGLPRAETARKALADWGALVTAPSLDAAIDVANAVAPEHLELAVADPWALLARIRHAGAIFMGPHSPEPVGDYFAGPNHVLPTNGTARFSSALGVETFCKRSSVVAASEAFTAANAAKIARLARLEGLEAHARSVEIRTNK